MPVDQHAPAAGGATSAGHPHPGGGPAATDPAELLRARGLRVTAPRLAVLGAVGDLPHADAETVLRRAREAVPTVSVQAVYDVLHALTDVGILRRIEPAGHPARYERRVDDNHHHVVCRSCGAVDDVDCVIGEAPCLVPSSTSGFTVETAEVTFWGLCPACRSRATD
ncbi:transcriptional repressor [Cellulomonas hominis]|uniref:Transcriptional repressor n=1 Tax=Cellulomonas hominis TaxID=156981 RepID=A0A7Z8NPM6_9CELL|nr:Fur family transcriptional regulator [Cellulomonas hominis]TKR22413.1 transcriptional repressor [Cellulomonas hominis]